MAIRQATGYALRTHPFGEANLIVEFYTLERGRVRVVARGARRLKSRYGSAFEPLTRSRLTWFQRDKDDLGRLSSTELDRSWFELLARLDTAPVAAYMSELVIGFAPEQDPSPTLYRLIGATLDGLEAGLDPRLAMRYFEIWMLRLSGLLPDLGGCGSCGRPLEGAAWVSEVTLDFLCQRHCGQMIGTRSLTGPAWSLVGRILANSPARLASEPTPQGAVRSLAGITSVLVRGHLDRVPRSLRVMRQLERRPGGRFRPC